MEDLIKNLQELKKAWEAGNYNAPPSTLTQGAAVQKEDLSPKMESVCWDNKHLIMVKQLDTESCKSNTHQFNVELSYGQFGSGAQYEGHVGQEETQEIARRVVPMSYYSHLRKVTIVSTLVDTFDGKKSDERAADAAAKKIAGDLEFDGIRGMDDFSNGGIFDGAPSVMPNLPNMHGVAIQIRQSDALRQTKDQMFLEFGGDESNVVMAGGTLNQTLIEEVHNRSVMNHGEAEDLIVDPKVLKTYNLLAIGKERIILANSPQGMTGSDLKEQAVSGGIVKIKMSRFMSGKTAPNPVRKTSPGAPASVTCASTTTSGVVTPFEAGEVYNYYVTAVNEAGESAKTAASALTIVATGDEVVLTITQPTTGTWRHYNVYRSPAGGTAASAKFIGRVITRSVSTTLFNDQGNKIPGFVTGLLVQYDTMEMRELAPFTRLKLAISELATTEAFYQFTCCAVKQPRKNAILESLTG
jgi:hypothetical protein